MVVDGFRVPDGQLQKDEGISMELQPPVNFGAGRIQSITDTQACYNTLLVYIKSTWEVYGEILSLHITTCQKSSGCLSFSGQTFPSAESDRMHPQCQV